MKRHLSLLFARRYLRSARSLSVINTTATVSSVAIGVAVAAMVVLMSVYNGFDGLVRSLYATCEADIVVEPTEGRRFKVAEVDLVAIGEIEGVEAVSLCLEESVMADYKGAQSYAILRGVDERYPEVVPLAEEGMMWYGEWKLTHGDYRRAVVGSDIDGLFGGGYSTRNAKLHDPLTLYTLRKESISPLVPVSALKSGRVGHAGSLTSSATTLTSHIFTSLDWAQQFLSAEGEASSVAVRTSGEGVSLRRVCRAIEEQLGEGFDARTRYEMNEVIYRATQAEKWGIFFILLLVTIIAAATIIGSLVMLITEKQNDVATLYAVGARRSFVREVFNLAGVLIGGRGVAGGVVLGVAVCLAQQRLGIVKMPGSTFLVENYPVRVALWDVVWIVVAVMAVTWILTNFTTSQMLARDKRADEIRNY